MDIINILEDIESYLKNGKVEEALLYIENKKREANAKKDKASDYIDDLIKNLK